MVTTFDRDDIIEAIEALVDGLVGAGERSGIRVVGGAAISISFGREVTTTDIDAVYGGSEAVNRIAAEIAARRGWPQSWLNDKVKMFMSHFDSDDDWTTFIVRDDVEVRIASARLLLAMKLRAARGARDAGDIDLLIPASGVHSLEEAVALYDHYYPEDELSDRALRQLSDRLEA